MSYIKTGTIKVNDYSNSANTIAYLDNNSKIEVNQSLKYYKESGSIVLGPITYIDPFEYIASNSGSSYIGGYENEIGSDSINCSIVAGSYHNIDKNYNSAIVCGMNNTISSNLNNSCLVGGFTNNLLGNNSVIIGGTGNTIYENVDRSVILGGHGISATTSDTVYGINANFTSYYGDGSNLSGVVSIDGFLTLTSASTTNWDITQSKNAIVTITDDITLEISNVSDGDMGIIRVVQGTSGNTLTFGTGTHKVVNDGNGQVYLSNGLNDVDILSFVYVDDEFYWNMGPNFT
jgi:hypothetical protein